MLVGIYGTLSIAARLSLNIVRIVCTDRKSFSDWSDSVVCSGAEGKLFSESYVAGIHSPSQRGYLAVDPISTC